VLAVAAVYFQLTRRFVQNVGPKSIAALSRDSGVAADLLERFAETGDLDGASVMRVWGKLFPDHTHLQANTQMDALQFQPLRE
jgi:hypothetical protein